jgi:hypothetical protein
VPSRLVQAQHLFFLLLRRGMPPIARERQKNEEILLVNTECSRLRNPFLNVLQYRSFSPYVSLYKCTFVQKYICSTIFIFCQTSQKLAAIKSKTCYIH